LLARRPPGVLHDGAVHVDKRTEPPTAADERATLVGVLERQRDTFAWKCGGLSAPQLADPAVPPSELSLLVLARHLAEVERSWFQRVMQGADQSAIWEPSYRPGSGVGSGSGVGPAGVDAAFQDWRRECERSRAYVRAAPSLDVTGGYAGQLFSLRYVLAHMIEEYARHNGHADLLRERLDGSTGE
jgi:hypothetical protein